MGDRSYASLTIVSLPYDTATVEAVADVVGGYDLFGDYTDAEIYGLDRTSTVTLRRSLISIDWIDEETNLDFCDRCRPLVDLGVTFAAFQEPKYEWDGEYLINVPPLGTASGDSDANESPKTTADSVADFLAAHVEDTVAEALAAYRRLWRLDVVDAWRVLRDARFEALRDSQRSELAAG